jgi:hypothetical protein
VVGLGGGREGRPRDGEERGEEEAAQEEHPVVVSSGVGGGEIWAESGRGLVGFALPSQALPAASARLGLVSVLPEHELPSHTNVSLGLQLCREVPG